MPVRRQESLEYVACMVGERRPDNQFGSRNLGDTRAVFHRACVGAADQDRAIIDELYVLDRDPCLHNMLYGGIDAAVLQRRNRPLWDLGRRSAESLSVKNEYLAAVFGIRICDA